MNISSTDFLSALMMLIGLILAVVIFYLGAASILAVVSLAFIVLVLMKNEYLLVFLLFFIPIFPKLNLIEIPGTLTAIRCEDLFFSLVIYCVFLSSLLRKDEFNFDGMKRLLIVFIMTSFASLIMGIIQGTIDANTMSFLFFLRRIEYISFFFVGYAIAGKNSINIIKKAVVPIFMIVGMIGILQATNLVGGFFHGSYAEGIGGRIFSTFGVPGEFAAFIAIIFTFSVLGIMGEKGLKRDFWILMAFFQIVVLFLTLSRAEMISIPIGLVVLGCLKRKTRQIIILMLAMLIILVIFAPANIKDRVAAVLSRDTYETVINITSGAKYVDINEASRAIQFGSLGYDLSAIERVYKWTDVCETFSHYPILGAGQSAFGDMVDNNYLRLLGENGIIGFTIFMVIIYQIWKNCVEVYNNNIATKAFKDYSLCVLIMLVNMLVIAVIGDVFEMSKIALFFWLLIGVFFKMKGIESKELKEAV